MQDLECQTESLDFILKAAASCEKLRQSSSRGLASQICTLEKTGVQERDWSSDQPKEGDGMGRGQGSPRGIAIRTPDWEGRNNTKASQEASHPGEVSDFLCSGLPPLLPTLTSHFPVWLEE